jgi:RNA:NAD 2'-phosphotransferase (TPT1/KptA family)
MESTQEQQFKKWFNRGIFTMKQVSVKTEIDRANVCRFVGKMKRSNNIYLVRKSICPITKDIAGFYTTNYNLYLTHKGLKR